MECPFKVGDRVKFTPDEHAQDWSWPTFDRLRAYVASGASRKQTSNDTDIYRRDEERQGKNCDVGHRSVVHLSAMNGREGL